MADIQGKLPLGATPGKLALIGVLAVVFVGVLVFQFGGMLFDATTANQPAAAQPADGDAPDGVVTASAPAALAPDEQPRPPWPPVSLQEALAHDPFAVSPALAVLLGPEPAPASDATAALDEADQLRAARLQETLDVLRHHGVSLIFDKGQGPLAAIGDQMLQIGDVIGGFRVVDISVQRGVVLEPLDDGQLETTDEPTN